MQDFSLLENEIGMEFADKNHILQAVTHRSYLNEHQEYKLDHNERLEFLGDAVLEIIVTEHLYNNYPDTPEGELTNWRASLVNSEMLAKVALEINLEKYLMLSKGESKDSNSKARKYILANAVEAVIGAIYLDKGIDGAKDFVMKYMVSKLDEILEKKLYMDPKSRFQEKAQEVVGTTPHYKVLSESGPDHAKMFEVGLYLGDERVAVGKGSSKQEAQIKAAEEGLDAKDWN